MLLNVQQFLVKHSLGKLEEHHGVIARASKLSNKFSLNYDQLMAKPGSRIVEECRGLVLAPIDGRPVPTDKTALMDFVPGETRIVAFPFRRFYNAHEVEKCAKIDWADPQLRVYEKLDGTLCIFYWDDMLNDWAVATRSMPDADLEITQDSILYQELTFRKLFERGFENTVGKPFAASQELLTQFKGKTLCFELTSPYNRVIVPYDKPEITLLMVRDNATGIELDPRDFNFPVPKTFPLTSLSDVVDWANTLEAEDSEGAVVTDSHYRRIKVKGIKWIMANRVKSSVNTKRDCMELILRGTIDDFMKYVPDEVHTNIEQLKEKTAVYLKKIEAAYVEFVRDAYGVSIDQEVRPTMADIRKEFAKRVMASGLWSAPLFTWWDKKCDFGIKSYIDYLITTKNLKRSTLDSLLKLVENDGNSNEDFQKKCVQRIVI